MSNIFIRQILLQLLVVAAAVTSGAAQLGAPICETLVPYSYDSRLINGNNSASSSALSSQTRKVVISYPNASYIQLDLSATHLANDDKLVLRSVTTTQILTDDALTYASNGYSAIFMGNSVSVKLVQHSYSRLRNKHDNHSSSPLNFGASMAVKAESSSSSLSSSSRVIVSHILVGGLCSNENNNNSSNNNNNDNAVVTPFSICGTSDERSPSTDIRQGRISLGGSCTAFMISKSIFVTAGHCGNATSNSRLKFTLNGTDIPVIPEDQYAIELSTYKKVYDNGFDWAAGRILPNAVTGKYPTSWYSIDTSLPTNAKIVRVTGYGTDNYDSTDDNTVNGGLNITCKLCQQTHLGKVTGSVSGAIRHNVDTMAGDSGAPLILESSDKVVAIHTNGGCSSGTSSYNVAKRFTQDFLNHIHDLQGRPAATLVPTSRPSNNPTSKPTNRPTIMPTNSPSIKPSTLRPTTTVPTTSLQPTAPPSTPSASSPGATGIPTNSPTTARPSSISSPTTSTPSTSTTSFKPSLSSTTSTPSTSTPSSNKPSLTPTTVLPTALPTGRFEPAKPVKTSLPTSAKPTTRTPSLKPTSTNPTTRTPSSKPTTANPTTRTPSSFKPTTWKPTTSSPTFASVKLTTLLCSINGTATTRECFRQNGNMFSIDAKVNITILSISVHSLSTTTGISAEVWTRPGHYSGYELNRTAWTKVGVSSINNNVGNMKSIPLSQVVNVNGGKQQSFYVTMSTNASYVLYGGNYTGVTTSSPIQHQSEFVQNNDISINSMGTANEYPFVRVIAPRYFNGEVVYRKKIVVRTTYFDVEKLSV